MTVGMWILSASIMNYLIKCFEHCKYAHEPSWHILIVEIDDG